MEENNRNSVVSFLETENSTEYNEGNEQEELALEVKAKPKEKTPVKTFSDLQILLQVLKKHFSTVCPECIDVLYDTMLRTAMSVSCPLVNPCCDDCSDLFRELLLRNIMNCNGCCQPSNCCKPACCNSMPCGSSCYPSCCLRPSCSNNSSVSRKKCSKVRCCSRPLTKCRPALTPRRSTSKQKSNPKRCPSSKITDMYKPKPLLINKQKYLRKQIRKVRQNIDCCNQCCGPVTTKNTFSQTKADDKM